MRARVVGATVLPVRERRFVIWWMVGVVVALLLLMAGCGRGSKKPGSTASTAASKTTSLPPITRIVMSLQPVRTLARLQVPVAGFAQDGPRIAWMTGRCQSGYQRDSDQLVLGRVAGGRRVVLAKGVCGSSALALAGTRVAYVSDGPRGYALATTAPRRPRRELRRLTTGTSNKAGPLDGDQRAGPDGDGKTLVYGVATTAMTDAACYTSRAPCTSVIRGGGAWRISSAGDPKRIAGVAPPALLAVDDGHIAVAPAEKTLRSEDGAGWARAALNGPVEIRDAASGHLETTFAPEGWATDVALAGNTAAVLVDDRTRSRTRIERYDARTGRLAAVAPVPHEPETLDASADGVVVYSVGEQIRVIVGSKTLVVARTAAAPIGLSINGRRIAWAENVSGRGRIRSTLLPS